MAWGLEQTKYFTQGCKDLVVLTDHKPLLKILSDKALDEISNHRIFSLKQRTLPWQFQIAHTPGKSNEAADAISRRPVGRDPDGFKTSINALLIGQHISDVVTVAAIRHSFSGLSWDAIAEETQKDPVTRHLLKFITGAPSSQETGNISPYLSLRHDLHVLEGVVLYGNRVVIPEYLRNNVLEHLHSGHQGVSAMSARARELVFWPGISRDIQSTRDSCDPCNRNARSQVATPVVESSIPSTPFEKIFADHFEFCGNHYLVAGDRLSGWVEVFRAPHHTALAGAKGLISALRSLFATFGVPEEISSDGGKEFVAAETKSFFHRWNIQHRLSSAHFPQSNGRAEVAVKKCKRLLMDNIGPNGSLNNDNFLRAILQVRNTPDPDSNISPAQILFGRPLRDAFSFVNRLSKFENPSIRSTWREAWSCKEEALKTRYARTIETLNKGTRAIPALKPGDKVFIQNQSGPHPTKWDASGTIMERGQHDQYTVKVDGTGRLTLRNRRFLRKFTPVTTSISHTPLPMIQSLPSLANQQQTPVQEPSTHSSPTAHQVNANPDHPGHTPEVPDVYGEHVEISVPHTESAPIDSTPAIVPVQELRLSTRIRTQRKRYVPETGKWE